MHHVLLGCYPVSFSPCSPMHFGRGYFYKCLLADKTTPRPHGGVKLMLVTGGEGAEEGSDYSPHTSSFSSTPQKCRKFILKPYGTYRYAVSLGGSARAQQYPPSLLGGPSPRLLSPSCHGTVSFTGFLITLLAACLLPGLQHLCCITVQNTIPALRQANCISFVSLAQLQKCHWN